MADSRRDDSGSSRAPAKGAEYEWLHRDREAPPGDRKPDEAPDHQMAPRAMLCDEGQLDDLYTLLCELGERPLRVRPSQLEELREWERPSKLFVTPVRVALAHPLPLTQASRRLVPIAVADGDAQTLCTAMLRRGFRYVVRRPVHPEALRLLMMEVLYSGRENRVVTRFPFGGEVRWRAGWHTGSCSMTEISAHGCRLLTPEQLPIGTRIHLKVASAIDGARGLRLRGRVVRRDLGREGGQKRGTHLAVLFERLSSRARAHLDALLAERASGPTTLHDATPSAAVDAPPRGPSRFLSLTREEQPPESPEPPAPETDRRRRPRAIWRHEVVALDPDTDRARLTLVGGELSTGGMRVEPHPLIRIGDRLKLALYDAGRAEPILVEARVAHDDGRRGFGLVFERFGPGVDERLERMVAGLPPVSTLDQVDHTPRGVVLGEIVSMKPR